jgi:hypothetical protein
MDMPPPSKLLLSQLFMEPGTRSWWSTSRTRLTLLYAKLDTASTTYVHCDVTVEADAVAASGALDEIPRTCRHGETGPCPLSCNT